MPGTGQKNIVFFLGAGASKNFGYPLTGEILPQILERLHTEKLFNAGIGKHGKAADFRNDLKRYMCFLYPGLNDYNPAGQAHPVPNITELLSMVDHCCLYNTPPHPELHDHQLVYFRELLNRAVGEILDTYDRKKYSTEESTLLKKFIDPVRELKKNSRITIITTNYDLIIDKEFKQELTDRQVDLGVAYRDVGTSELVLQPQNPLFKYYKLHGSLNWLRCDLCGYYYVNTYGSIIMNAFLEEVDDYNTCTCSDKLALKSVLVAPSIVRDIRDSNLLQIWKSALEAIRTADRLVMVGYSIPGEDLAIKSILMRGINGRSREKNYANNLLIDVVQHGDNAKSNYFNFFGSNFTYYPGGLKEYLDKNPGLVS